MQAKYLPFSFFTTNMRLRIRHASGMATLSDITAEQTVLELKKDISKAIGLAPGQEVESE